MMRCGTKYRALTHVQETKIVYSFVPKISKPLGADVNYIHAFKVTLYTIFQSFEYHMRINIVFRWQMLANHIPLG